MKKRYIITGIMSGMLCLEIGCSPSTENLLDTELTTVLQNRSFTGDLDYYKLPSSTDYANIPQDPLNPITTEKVALGQLIFHDPAFGTDVKFAGSFQTYSCASCHNAKAGFQAGVIQGIADGGIGFGLYGEGRVKDPVCHADSLDVQAIRTPAALNVAYQKNMLWNGSLGATGFNVGTSSQWILGKGPFNNHLGYEGVETQAIAGQDVHRMRIDSIAQAIVEYKNMFDAAFPNEPTSSRYTDITAALAIAAYERTLLANEAPFQRWLNGENNAMTEQQKEGAILFFDKANCAACHNGPSLATEGFHALGIKDLYQVGGSTVFQSDASSSENQGRGGFSGNNNELYQFKVPQLYNLTNSPLMGHGGSFTSVEAIVRYKNNAIAENPNVPANKLSPLFTPLGLTDEEIEKIVDFLENALNDPNLERYEPTSVPSGLCFPNADPQSRAALGCN